MTFNFRNRRRRSASLSLLLLGLFDSSFRSAAFLPQHRAGSTTSAVRRPTFGVHPPSSLSAGGGSQAVELEEYDISRIRNFSIIAHIDHGKSTLADRILEYTRTVKTRDMQAQLLDNMDIERERGITIKLQAARVVYRSKEDGELYVLNLIDTPGHVDFTYEVSRSLAACEGALLVVDASQGIEAQTVANVYLALENDLEVIPVLNKIDLPAADPTRVAEEIEDTIGLDITNIVECSAKSGIGIEDILERIVKDVPCPKTVASFEGDGGIDGEVPFKALIFDSMYDQYRGVVVFFRVVDGEIKKGEKVRFMASGAEHEVVEVGVMRPGQTPVETLRAGEVGYIAASIRNIEDAKVGDTITKSAQFKRSAALGEPYPSLPGYAESVPMVFCGLFPVDANQYETLRDSLGKLKLNDGSLTFEPENSSAMGFGFRCGFLGLLHMEIVQERLEREYDLDLIVTAPAVKYKIKRGENGVEEDIDSPSKMPDTAGKHISFVTYFQDILRQLETKPSLSSLASPPLLLSQNKTVNSKPWSRTYT